MGRKENRRQTVQVARLALATAIVGLIKVLVELLHTILDRLTQ